MEKRNNEKGITVIGLIIVSVIVVTILLVIIRVGMSIHINSRTNKLLDNVMNSEAMENKRREIENDRKHDALEEVKAAISKSVTQGTTSSIYSELQKNLEELGAIGLPSKITENSFPLIIEVEGFSFKITEKDDRFEISNVD